MRLLADVGDVHDPLASWRGFGGVREWTTAAVGAYSLILAAYGGLVFYASIRPFTIGTGYFAVFVDLPWIWASFLLLGVWGLGSAGLLVLGLIQLRRTGRLSAGWLAALGAGAAIGYAVRHDFERLLSAYPIDADGSPLGPSHWAPGSPYWPALVAVGGELAVGAVMIALIAMVSRDTNRGIKSHC